MKYIFAAFVILLPHTGHAQDTINPYNIQQPRTIELHRTDAYYKPYYPPDSNWPRIQFSNQAQVVDDSNGVFPGGVWPVYQPMVRGRGELLDTPLMNWKPYGITLGPTASWQRLFTAERDSAGNAHDIIAGGDSGDYVIISKNEDVDFRASGTVKLKNGFHAKPGCFFHAYQEPRWGATVFHDEFDSTAVDRSKWVISNGHGSDYGMQNECSNDTNATIDTDYQATDGHALDIALRYIDSCNCYEQSYSWADCNTTSIPLSQPDTFQFSSAILNSCPYPVTSTSPWGVAAYAHMPYGRYEVREKIPHVLYHTNNWMAGYNLELDMDETFPDDLVNNGKDTVMSNYHVAVYQKYQYGPYTGTFVNHGTDTLFISTGPQWCPSNSPDMIVVDKFPYMAGFSHYGHDTLAVANNSPVPPLLLASGAPVSFYYTKNSSNTADSLLWTVTKDSSGHWRIFSAAYHDSSGHLLKFSKAYQPTSVTVTGYDSHGLPDTLKTYGCQWDSSINSPTDRGLLYLSGSGIGSSDLHSYTEKYGYYIDEAGYGQLQDYPIPPIPLDTTNYTTGGYTYHTFALELLPNEARFLQDGNVVYRFPDRMIPPTDKHYNWISSMYRSSLPIMPGETDIEPGVPAQLTWFLDHTSGKPWYWNNAAHELIDYVRVYDVPSDVTIPGLPR